jgi:ribonuclease Z
VERELTVLGTAAQTPTRLRNHNGYVLRWDDEAILFDPGEGTQRQMIHADWSAARLTRICITHFHGDHCLGLPGVLSRRGLDRTPRPIDVYFPAEHEIHFTRLRTAAAGYEAVEVRSHPCDPGIAATGPPFRLVSHRLRHSVPTLGWRIEEPDGRRMLPDRLAAAGVHDAAVGVLQQEGSIQVGERTVTLDEVSEERPGQRFAFVMDTALCDEAFELAAGADLLVCEATFLSADAHLARAYQHLTAAQAARIAAEAGARRLVLTHLSQRYPHPERFHAEAAELFDDVVVVSDLDRVPVPDRRP